MKDGRTYEWIDPLVRRGRKIEKKPTQCCTEQAMMLTSKNEREGEGEREREREREGEREEEEREAIKKEEKKYEPL